MLCKHTTDFILLWRRVNWQQVQESESPNTSHHVKQNEPDSETKAVNVFYPNRSLGLNVYV